MREETEYTIEDIIIASQQRREYKATGDISKRLSLHTKTNINLKLEDTQKVQKIIDFIESKYKVKLKIIGGGYGCTKLSFKVEGVDDALELAKKLLRDEEFKELAKDIQLDVIVVPEKYQTLKINQTQHSEHTPDKTRVSADGSIQSTGT